MHLTAIIDQTNFMLRALTRAKAEGEIDELQKRKLCDAVGHIKELCYNWKPEIRVEMTVTPADENLPAPYKFQCSPKRVKRYH